ncbi:MAG: 2-hydroxychromene-2-carboxylate isomerase [SAR324 cluster bacterium]|nr:2-hydroxychromene-2-carboxylate isomerase [SAR324 cluster bacterium]
MKTLDWYFDVISPFAYLQMEKFDQLPKDLEIVFKPVLFAGLLGHWGHKGPAEIPEKRKFTYRHSQWLANQMGIEFKMPAAHPFNPLKGLRLAIACSNYEGIREIFRYVWKEGHLFDEAENWQELITRLGMPDADLQIAKPEIKTQLQKNGEEATARGVFGVPTFVVDQEIFWGLDATRFLLDYLDNPQLFQEGEMARISQLPAAQHRQNK